MQINVTSVHKNKFRRTKYGHGFGYGPHDKLSPEDQFLKTIFDAASPEVREKKRIRG